MTVPGITKQLKLSKCSALLRVLACICLASAWEHTTSFVLIFLNYSILALAVHFVLCQTLLAHDSGVYHGADTFGLRVCQDAPGTYEVSARPKSDTADEPSGRGALVPSRADEAPVLTVAAVASFAG